MKRIVSTLVLATLLIAGLCPSVGVAQNDELLTPDSPTLTVSSGDQVSPAMPFDPPTILGQPKDAKVRPGQVGKFKVDTYGLNLKYQWYLNDQPLTDQPGAYAGTKTAEVTVAIPPAPSVSSLENMSSLQAEAAVQALTARSGTLYVVVQNDNGSEASMPATLTVDMSPVLIVEPGDAPLVNGWPASIKDGVVTVSPGKTVALTAFAVGLPAPTYRWAINGQPIDAASAAPFLSNGGRVLSVPVSSLADGGSFTVSAANAAGSVVTVPLRVAVSAPSLGLKDKFKDRPTLASTGSGVVSNKDTGSAEPLEPLHAGKTSSGSVWAKWIAPSSGVWTFHTQGSDFDTVLAVYKGPQLGQLTPVASDDEMGGYHTSLVRFNAQQGQEYQIALAGFSRQKGNAALSWYKVQGVTAMPTVVNATAPALSVSPGATPTMAVELNDVALAGQLQWYRDGVAMLASGAEFTATTPGIYTVMVGAAEIARFEVQVNTEGLTAVAVNRQAEAQAPTLLPTQTAVVPKSKSVRSALSRGASIPGFQAVRRNAVDGSFSGSSGTQFYSTSPGKDPGEMNHCGEPGGASYWYNYVPAASGRFSLNTDGSSYNTVLAVYKCKAGYTPETLTSYADLESVTCDNSSSGLGGDRVAFNVTAGVTYYVVTDGVGGAYGSTRLNYALNLLPSISSVTAQNINEDNATAYLGFTVSDSETDASALTVTTTTSNAVLLPTSRITLGGSASSRTVRCAPAANKYGSATVTLTVTDAGGASQSTSFLLVVNSVNDAPIVYANYTSAGQGANYISISSLLGNDYEVDPGDLVNFLSVGGSSTLGGTVSLSGGYVIYTPKPGTSGSDSFSYTTRDNYGATTGGTVSVSLGASGE